MRALLTTAKCRKAGHCAHAILTAWEPLRDSGPRSPRWPRWPRWPRSSAFHFGTKRLHDSELSTAHQPTSGQYSSTLISCELFPQILSGYCHFFQPVPCHALGPETPAPDAALVPVVSGPLGSHRPAQRHIALRTACLVNALAGGVLPFSCLADAEFLGSICLCWDPGIARRGGANRGWQGNCFALGLRRTPLLWQARMLA